MIVNPDKMMKAVHWNILMVCFYSAYVDIVWYDIACFGTFGGYAYYHMAG